MTFCQDFIVGGNEEGGVGKCFFLSFFFFLDTKKEELVEVSSAQLLGQVSESDGTTIRYNSRYYLFV